MTIKDAMVLAAGLGTRLRSVSGALPKPLVRVGGKALMDWTLDGLAGGGISHAVVNVHYRAELIIDHLKGRERPSITISDEEGEALETGGGLMRATPHFHSTPIVCANTDAILLGEDGQPAADLVSLLAAHWDDTAMDALLLLVPRDQTSGYTGDGDFDLTPSGQIKSDPDQKPFVFTGLQIIRPRLWAGQEPTRQSTWVFWRRAMAEGRFHGIVHSGRWLHVGDPEGYDLAQNHFYQVTE